VDDRCGRLAVPKPAGPIVTRSFFDRPAVVVAPELLGCVIEHRTAEGVVSVRLTEVEAYHGDLDPGSHAFRGQTPRNAVMFGPPGRVYVYFTYGMHYCMNLVCAGPGVASAVLLRAGEIVEGAELAASRRGTGTATARDLARGPARLTVALGVGRAHNGVDVCGRGAEIRIRWGAATSAVLTGPRVGVSAGADTPWRFWLDGEPTVSSFRSAKRRVANP
jgi:DNA-3-methyladenine glycosylase